jgi:hypothetical protein
VNDRPDKSPTDEAWLTTKQALELIRAHFRCSEGRAENLRREAVASGDVRLCELTLMLGASGDGVLYSNRITPAEAASRMEYRPDAFAGDLSLRINEPDLRAWISAQAPAPLSGRRYASDDDLVIEGVSGIRSGDWSNPSVAAEALADRARGHSRASTVTRLRKKIGAALED